MGALVGGTFGSIIGLYSAIKQRQLLLFPISALASGVSFGFFMACGTMVRTDEMNVRNQLFIDYTWKQKYARKDSD
jgi:hypothetical protein